MKGWETRYQQTFGLQERLRLHFEVKQSADRCHIVLAQQNPNHTKGETYKDVGLTHSPDFSFILFAILTASSVHGEMSCRGMD
jgi:hypothetical protein